MNRQHHDDRAGQGEDEVGGSLRNNNNNPHYDWQTQIRNNRVPSRRMDHTYRDYAYYSLGNLPAASKTPSNFPSKLHHILSDPENHHVS